MRTADVVVVGGGIMGSTIASYLRAYDGRDVLLIDDARPESGSKASGGLIKPSKLSGLSREEEASVVEVMENLFGVDTSQFAIAAGKGPKVTIHVVNMDDVFKTQEDWWMTANVTAVAGSTGGGKCTVEYAEHAEGGGMQEGAVRCNFVVLACGFWCSELIPDAFPGDSLTAKKGISFLFPGHVPYNLFKPWAPFKQVVLCNTTRRGKPVTWAGDGTALKPENWAPEREQQSLNRVWGALGTKQKPMRVTTGLRPFHSSHAKPCFLEEVASDVWAATGAGKMGCVAAAWAARQLSGRML